MPILSKANQRVRCAVVLGDTLSCSPGYLETYCIKLTIFILFVRVHHGMACCTLSLDTLFLSHVSLFLDQAMSHFVVMPNSKRVVFQYTGHYNWKLNEAVNSIGGAYAFAKEARWTPDKVSMRVCAVVRQVGILYW